MKALLTLSFLITFSMGFSQETELEKEKKLSKEYLHKMSMEEDAFVTNEGIVMRKTGCDRVSTKSPSCLSDIVTTTYDLITRSGDYTETSMRYDMFFKVELDLLIQCWEVALQKMYVGQMYKISCPSDTAYGDEGYIDQHGNQIIKGGEALTFRVYLHDVESSPKIELVNRSGIPLRN